MEIMYLTYGFLTNLFIYFLATGLFVAFFEPPAKLGINLTRKIFNKIPILLIVIFLYLFSITLQVLSKVGFPLYSSFFG